MASHPPFTYNGAARPKTLRPFPENKFPAAHNGERTSLILQASSRKTVVPPPEMWSMQLGVPSQQRRKNYKRETSRHDINIITDPTMRNT